MDNDNIDDNYINSTNNNKSKVYKDEANNVNTKKKASTKKTKKKGKITEKASHEQESIINNENEKERDNPEEENKINVILQDNKATKKETIEDILNKETAKKKLPPISIEKNENEEYKEDVFIDNSVSTPNMNMNKYLKIQIGEKTKQIEELSLSQDINKKALTDILKKLNITIKANAELLYSGADPMGNDNKKNENKKDKEDRMKELNILLEKKKQELNISKETNKSFKTKYENMMKEYTTSSTEKIDYYQKKIEIMKNSNSDLNKKIHILNYNNHLKGKKLDLNTKMKHNNEIKIHSDIYTTLMKEKYNQYAKLNNNKKLIKDIMEQFQYLIKIINNEDKDDKNKTNDENEKNNVKIINPDLYIDINKIKDLKMKEDINILKIDLIGNEEDIYKRIVGDETLTLGNYNKIKNRPMSIINKNKAIKKVKISIQAISKNFKENKIKKLVNSKSCNDIAVKDKEKLNNYNEVNLNLNINNEDMIFNEIKYESMTNHDYEKITNKRQKYYNLDEKLDKSIKDLSIFYENKIKDINAILDINSKKLSNIQQENELLKSKIADLRRILELNIKEQKLIKQNQRYKNINLIENNINNDFENHKEKEKFDINEIGKNLEIKIKNTKSDYINMLKDKYKVKKKVLHKDDDIDINSNDIDYDL